MTPTDVCALPARLAPPFIATSTRRLVLATVLAWLLGASLAWAQTTAPRFLEFSASADHATLLSDGRPAVSFYQAEFLLAGAAAPFQVASLGKPTPAANGTVAYDLSGTPVAWPVAGGSYTVRVTAVGPNGEGRSAPSAPFVVGSAAPPPPDPAPSGEAVLEVGPGKPAATLADIAWDRLAPGALVRIHWRPEPYREKWLISASGTAEAPIVIQGVPSPTGILPVIDGSGATTAGAWSHSGEQLGVVVVAPETDTSTPPAHLVIESLDIRGARPPGTFVSAAGTTLAYAPAAASLYLENASDIVIRNCVLRDSGQGLAVASTGTGAARRITVTGNHLHGNGNVGSALEHNASAEAIGITYEGNRFGPLRPGALGSGLGDRSAGLVVRANWIEGGERELELLDARSAVVRSDAHYRRTFVYGNVILEPAGTDSAVIVRYGGDSGKSSRYRQGVLYFYNNTVVSGRTTGTTLLELSTFLERADVRNNIVSAPAGGLTIAQRSGTIDLGRNWLQAGYQPTAAGFGGTFNNAGLVIAGAAPGFAGAASQDFRLASGSPAADVASALAAAALPANDVTRQYVAHRQAAARASVGTRDLGALERGVNPALTFTLSGRVADTAGAPLADALVTATGGLSAATRTDTRGIYTLPGVPGGSSVTVTPTLATYGFTPPSATFASVTGDRAADFVGSTSPNAPPTVSLTSPAHGATFTAPASVTLAASAADSDGSVARVEFYRDATLVATDTSAPYAAALSGLAAGSYTLTATAVDNRGATTSSQAAVISVASAGPTPVATTIAARADTYVRGGAYATVNYGTSDTLQVRKATVADEVRESYLLYKVSVSVAGQRVMLRLSPRLTAASSTPVAVQVFGVSTVGWTDSTFTYNTRPVSDATPLASFSVAGTTATVVEIDVTAYVQAIRARGGTRVALALKGAASTAAAVTFPSREAGAGTPVLVVR